MVRGANFFQVKGLRTEMLKELMSFGTITEYKDPRSLPGKDVAIPVSPL